MSATQPPPLHKLPVAKLKGVGAKLAETLVEAGILTVQDVLFTLPLRYEDRTRVSPISDLTADARAQVEGEIVHVNVINTRARNRRLLKYRIADHSGELHVTLFRFYPSQLRTIRTGNRVRLFGQPKRNGLLGWEMVHPEYKLIDPGRPEPLADTLDPIYPSRGDISSERMRRITGNALEWMRAHPPEDWAPQPDAPSLAEALQLLHRPTPDVSLQMLEEGVHPCQRRLAFEELLAQRIALLENKQRMRSLAAPAMRPERDLGAELIRRLPFSLTGAQRRCAREITADMQRDFPMQRLLQGDVGSGKTVVAVLAALWAMADDYQIALMAPTEILAEQHFINISEWMTSLGRQTEWLTGSVKGRARAEALERLRTQTSPVVVGTHALLEEPVKFRRLGLVIIDEQHRFGVEQRWQLNAKAPEGTSPHQLILTATPIPRTLAMTLYADMDVSKLDELPPGRKPIKTSRQPWSRRGELIALMRRRCLEGRQCYWVCPLIDESDAVPAAAVLDSAKELARAMPDVRVEVVHGRMSSAEQSRILRAFRSGDIDVLVATSVIEVGVDIPNASIMLIENAERFGLAQLHQLRGRVGRGPRESFCVLLHPDDLEPNQVERLDALVRSNDGFAIAEADLRLRREGELLGTQQKGMPALRIANYGRDSDLLSGVRRSADALLRSDPERAHRILERWINLDAIRFHQV